MSYDVIKGIFKTLLSSDLVKGKIVGPKENVLECETMNDWIIAGSELAKAGFICSSPGGYGGSHPTSRQNTHFKIWKTGSLCAVVIEKKVLLFSLPQSVSDYCQIPLFDVDKSQ